MKQNNIVSLIVFILPFIILLNLSYAYSQSLSLRLSNYIYTWEQYDTILKGENSTSKIQIRNYQNVLSELNYNGWTLNIHAQTDGDLIHKIGKGFNYRFYNLYIKATSLFNRLDLKIGRHYVFAGVGRGNVDGLYLKYKAGENKEIILTGYGGFLTSQDFGFNKYHRLKDNYIFGTQLSFYGIKGLSASISYVNKNRKPISYETMRLDSALNTVIKRIDIDMVDNNLAGFDVNYSHKNGLNSYAKLYFDISRRKFYRGELNLRIPLLDKLRISTSYYYRLPQINSSSIFWVFAHKSNQEFEVGIDYNLKSGINIFSRFSTMLYQKDESFRFQAGLNHTNFGLSYIKYTGFAGESDGLTTYLLKELIRNKLSLSSALNYSSYRIGDFESERENSLNSVVGFTYKPNPHLSIDIQGQFLINKIYKIDTRLLLGFNCWFFKNFSIFGM